ncbi:MAG: redoxin domain-containing protein [Thermoanaerobaculia bacterium]
MMRILAIVLCTLPLFANDVRSLYVASDVDAASRAFELLPNPSVEERAFGVAAYAFAGRVGRAKEQLAILKLEAPDDPWTHYAAAAAVMSDDPQAALVSSEAMLAKAGARADEEMVRQHALVLMYLNRTDDALLMLAQHPQTLRLRAMRGLLLATRGDEADAAKLYETLRRESPEFLDGWLAPGRNALNRRKPVDAYPLLKQAAALTTSPRVHGDYWRALASTAQTDEQKKAEFEADMQSLLEHRNQPEVWVAIANEYLRAKNYDEAAKWVERTIAEAPNTLYAARAMNLRYTLFSRNNPDYTKDPKLRAEAKKLLRDYLDYRAGEEDLYRTSAYSALFYIARADPDTPAEELVEAVQNVLPSASWSPNFAAEGATLLADRGVRLDLAEEAARAGFEHIKKLAKMEEEAEYVDAMRAWMHDSLGWVLLKRGDLDGARNQLFAAYELHPDSPTFLHHLGQWYEARKNYTKAEQLYRRGAALPTSQVNHNEAALRALYVKRNGSDKGFDAYLKNTAKSEVVYRRTRVLGERKKNPAPAADFRLKTLDGKEVSLASLKGKTAVINFWGIWCGWCVKEMPEFQQLAKKYASDPSVAILTINNDGDAENVRKWMAKQKYDFHVLLDDGFVEKNKIHGFPTTWFLDKSGRIAFEKRGWTKELLEEFSWRVEALKGQ